MQKTGLPRVRLEGEWVRTVIQLKFFMQVVLLAPVWMPGSIESFRIFGNQTVPHAIRPNVCCLQILTLIIKKWHGPIQIPSCYCGVQRDKSNHSFSSLFIGHRNI